MKIILEGKPLSTNHIYQHRGRITYMTKEGKKMKEYYSLSAKTQHRGYKCFTGLLEVEIWLYFGDKRVRDADNYNKLVLDALTGICYKDDKQIQRLIINKEIDVERPRIELEIKVAETKKQ